MAVRNFCISAVLLLALLGTCASNFRATYDHDLSHHFLKEQISIERSQNLLQVGNPSVTVSPLLELRIMSVLEKGLVARGFRLDWIPDDAGFVLSFGIG